MVASVGTPLSTETGQAVGVIALQPALQGARRQLVLMSDRRQWLSTFQDESQYVEALHRLRPLLFRQVRQRQNHVRGILLTSFHHDAFACMARVEGKKRNVSRRESISAAGVTHRRQ